jgi:hypothetical protein
MSAEEISTVLDLGSVCGDRPWHVQGTSAVSASGAGLYEGFDWLSNAILAQNQRRQEQQQTHTE